MERQRRESFRPASRATRLRPRGRGEFRLHRLQRRRLQQRRDRAQLRPQKLPQFLLQQDQSQRRQFLSPPLPLRALPARVQRPHSLERQLHIVPQRQRLPRPDREPSPLYARDFLCDPASQALDKPAQVLPMLQKDALGLRRDRRGQPARPGPVDLHRDSPSGLRAEDVPGKRPWAARDPALREAQESPRRSQESRCTHESLPLRADAP